MKAINTSEPNDFKQGSSLNLYPLKVIQLVFKFFLLVWTMINKTKAQATQDNLKLQPKRQLPNGPFFEIDMGEEIGEDLRPIRINEWGLPLYDLPNHLKMPKSENLTRNQRSIVNLRDRFKKSSNDE